MGLDLFLFVLQFILHQNIVLAVPSPASRSFVSLSVLRHFSSLTSRNPPLPALFASTERQRLSQDSPPPSPSPPNQAAIDRSTNLAKQPWHIWHHLPSAKTHPAPPLLPPTETTKGREQEYAPCANILFVHVRLAPGWSLPVAHRGSTRNPHCLHGRTVLCSAATLSA